MSFVVTCDESGHDTIVAIGEVPGPLLTLRAIRGPIAVWERSEALANGAGLNAQASIAASVLPTGSNGGGGPVLLYGRAWFTAMSTGLAEPDFAVIGAAMAFARRVLAAHGRQPS